MTARLFAGTVLLIAAGCQRHADVRDQLEAPFKPPPTIQGDAEVLDTGLATDAFPSCTSRPAGPCVSPTDFACAFSPWFAKIADRCATETGCKANGTVEATTSDDGCVVDIAMDRPNDAFVTCVVRDVGSVRCPCGKVTASYFLGLGNNGCTPCGREFVCPNGDVCVAGQCVRASPDAGKRDAGG